MSSSFSSQVLNGSYHGHAPESFGGFFDTWLREKETDLEDLKAAIAYSESTRSCNESMRNRVRRIMGHYENYYRVKSESTKKYVLKMFSPPWMSNPEGSFLWIGGWRTSTTLYLLFSVAGIQFEARFGELLRGLRTATTGDQGDLSHSQLTQVNELQVQTICEEKDLTERLAAQQEIVADTSMVELSHIATELMRDSNSKSSGQVGTRSMNERVESTLDTKQRKFKEIQEKADDLRLRTLRNVVDILTPIQAVHFLIAAVVLHLRVHEWGMKKDAIAHSPQN
ncbi:protein DOG1-like 3 [Spinacia oleracea]|uniref:Protein DOG1-like 3 n=1 Tax=Spinacia oleracea TaxID=3562 RepID=A0ABM3RP17_SPIOL|nr:protein DOG1-like 3 [Spinacia oleracea]